MNILQGNDGISIFLVPAGQNQKSTRASPQNGPSSKENKRNEPKTQTCKNQQLFLTKDENLPKVI